MAIVLPSWVIEKVGPATQADDGAILLSDRADTAEIKYSEIFSTVEDLLVVAVDVAEVGPVQKWRYAEISVGTSVICELIEIPSTWGDEKLPSAIEKALAQAWCIEDRYDPAQLCERFPNNALICWRTTTPRIGLQAALASAGLSQQEVARPLEQALRERTRLRIEDDSSLVAPAGATVYARLLQRAIVESHAELRFLYLYRIFERAYFASAFATLSAEFFSNPKGALSAADKMLSNERLSFISLVQSSGDVNSWFELIEEEMEGGASSNQFMAAVKRSCENDGWLSDKEKWRRGCSTCYKIRCAIVHSGERGPIFEEFLDATAACAILVPYLEAAATAFLKISSNDAP